MPKIKLGSLIPVLSFLALCRCQAASPDAATNETDEPAKAEAKAKVEAKTETKTETETAAKPAAAPESSLDRSAAEAKREAAKAKFGTADEATLRATKAKMLTTLNEGRKLVKDDKLDEGIAKYRELLAIDPQYGPALGELGWAEFKASRLDEARAHTLQALAVAPDDKRRGMLHYNLGRIAEDRGETEAAIEAYALSLEFRPNEVVASRLAQISTVVDAAGTAYVHPAVEAYRAKKAGKGPALTSLKLLAGGLPTPEAACQAIDELCYSDSCKFHGTADGSAGIVEIEDDGLMNCWHPVIKLDDGWTIFSMALLGQWGTEIDQSIDAFALRIVDNAAGSFLIIEYGDHTYERTWTYEDLEEANGDVPEGTMNSSEGMIICRRTAPLLCTGPIATKYLFSDDEREASYAATVTLDGDVVVVSDVVRSDGFDMKDGETLEAGRYELAALAK